MDCQAARGSFSEYLDQRLPSEQRSMLEDHLALCQECRDEWRAYQRVFNSVAGIREEPALREFTLPREAPGRLDRSSLSLPGFDWARARVAASILVLLAVSHVAVFEWARGGDEVELPEPRFPRVEREPRVGEARLVPVSDGAATFRHRLNDHVDAAQLLARQIHYMPDGAESKVRDIVRAQLRALDSEELLEDLEAGGAQLAGVAPTARLYLDRWRRFSDGLEADLAFADDGDVLARRMRRRLQSSPVLGQFTPVRVLLASEPTGLTWRKPEMRARLAGAEFISHDDEVKSYLVAHEKLLTAEYMDAIEMFDRFGRRHGSSALLPLSRYLQAEGLRRAGLHVEALQVASQLGFGTPSSVIMRIDPLTAMWTVMRRRVPPSVLQQGGTVLIGQSQQILRGAQLRYEIEFRRFRRVSDGGIRLSIESGTTQAPRRRRREH